MSAPLLGVRDHVRDMPCPCAAGAHARGSRRKSVPARSTPTVLLSHELGGGAGTCGTRPPTAA
eukprot:2714390-Prymnesium_polylepis.1